MTGEKIKAGIIFALHAHLPYVRIPEKKFPLQEVWLFQALTECYIPLVKMLDDLTAPDINFKITLSFSPTLISMLSDDYYKQKYSEYLGTIKNLLEKIIAYTEENLKKALISLYEEIQEIDRYYKTINCNPISKLKSLSQSGKVLLITTAATHAVLPLYRFSAPLLQLQIKTGIDVFENAFQFRPDGFWLPEMGYCPQVGKLLIDNKIKYTFLDTHSIFYSRDHPESGNFYPLITGAGLRIFPRELKLSNKIWSADHGYPGDCRYREFHFDYAYSLDDKLLNEFDIDRIPFGLKIYKITGKNLRKEYYDKEEALSTAREHAEGFIKSVRDRADAVIRYTDKIPVFVLPFDAELFGHWWKEGIAFLKHAIKIISVSGDIALMSPSDFFEEKLELVKPAETSWGNGGFFSAWTNAESSWIYPKIAGLMSEYSRLDGNTSQAGIQAAKEIMLACSSDWTFFIANNTSKDYGKLRLSDHLNAAKKILSDIASGRTEDLYIAGRRETYPLFEKVLSRISKNF